jgi:dolichol-phosphate mannosyltransferase
MPLKYSIVIPLKDEEGNIASLIEEIEPVMKSLKEPWELICIDDGSQDSTLSILKKLQNEKDYLKIIAFDKNYGQSSAFDAGFRSAAGEFVITLDGDRQNDPTDIPHMAALAKEYDLVCGIRQKRKDTFVKRAISFWANAIRSRLCRDGVKDTGCSLKIYRKSCLEKIKMYNGMHRFLPALFRIEGFRIAQTPVNHRQRDQGSTKYNFFNRSFNTVFDLFAVRWMSKRHLNYKTKKTEL